MYRVFIIVWIIAIVVLSGCSKKDSDTQRTKGSVPEGPIKTQYLPKTATAPSEARSRIIVPDDVKKRWKFVILTIEDRDKKTSKDFTVMIGGETDVPGSRLRVQTKEFLPDFRMDADVKTSISNEKNNPALRIKIFEGGKEIFEGWLFSKFPEIHPFEHQRYSIKLKDAM